MTNRRYGLYLRPSPAMCRAQVEIHDLLARQYHLLAARKFMPHATLKGFFRSDAPVAELIERVDAALAGILTFSVHNHGVVPFLKESIVLDIHGASEEEWNPPLIRLHEASLAALLPVVRPDCEFTPREWTGKLFHAHLTLAMADVPAPFFDEILAFVKGVEPIGPATFAAEVVQLVAFESEAWTGRWWETLRWDLLHSWRLP